MELVAAIASLGGGAVLAVLVRAVTAAVAPDTVTIPMWRSAADAAIFAAAIATQQVVGQSLLVAGAAIVALGAVLAATHIDVAYRRIPNRLTAGVAAILTVITVMAVATGTAGEHVAVALAYGVAAPVLLYILSGVYARYTGMAGFGMGDIKLVGPLVYATALAGPPAAAVFTYMTFLAAAIVSGVLLVTGRATRNTRMPFAPYFAAGMVAATVLWPHLA